MMIVLRLYEQPGCVHCQSAEKFLVDNGVGDNTQGVIVGSDPVATLGVEAILGKEKAAYPVLVSFLTTPPEVIVGFHQEHYARIAKLCSALHGNRPPNSPAPEGHNTESPKDMVAEEAPAVSAAS